MSYTLWISKKHTTVRGVRPHRQRVSHKPKTDLIRGHFDFQSVVNLWAMTSFKSDKMTFEGFPLKYTSIHNTPESNNLYLILALGWEEQSLIVGPFQANFTTSALALKTISMYSADWMNYLTAILAISFHVLFLDDGFTLATFNTHAQNTLKMEVTI